MSITAVLASVVIALAVAGQPKAKPPKPLNPMAERIVNDVVHVKEGEVVFIQGSFEDAALLGDIWLAAAKKGASPIIRIQDPKLERRYFDVVMDAYDKNAGIADDRLTAIPDVLIVIDRRDQGPFKDVPAARRAAIAQSFTGQGAKVLKRGTRVAYIGNGMWPTAEAAKAVGVGLPELKKLFDAGVAVEGRELFAAGDALRMEIPSGKDLRVTTPAGTDVRFKLTAKPMVVSDGSIGSDDVKQGGAALMTWLPAGEVYGLLAPGTAEGKIVLPRYTHDGQEIKDLTVTIAAGKITGMTTAKPSKAFDSFKALYDAAPAGKDALSVFDIGLNPKLKVKKKPLQSFLPAGSITLIAGGDEWAGGTNAAPFVFVMFLPDATLLSEGKNLIIENGELKLMPKPPTP